MRASFGSPEAILQNLTVVQAARRLYGIDVWPAHVYTDCKTPGIQAMIEKMFPMFCFPFEGKLSDTGALGLLSAGQDYSPVQQLLELDVQGGINRLLGTYEVSDKTLGLDLFEKVKKEGLKIFLELDHTLENYKSEQWYPRWLDRQIWQTDEIERTREQKMLNEIDAYWKDAVKRYKKPDIDEKRLNEARKVLKAAEAEAPNIKA
jgi:trimethylamine:corrinoid methyltransferase-like protein